MINTKRLLKVGAAWVSIVYAICFIGVWLIPGVRPLFMKYALHTVLDIGQDVMTLGIFISGLIIWNIIAFVALGLFAWLFNRIKN